MLLGILLGSCLVTGLLETQPLLSLLWLTTLQVSNQAFGCVASVFMKLGTILKHTMVPLLNSDFYHFKLS